MSLDDESMHHRLGRLRVTLVASLAFGGCVFVSGLDGFIADGVGGGGGGGGAGGAATCTAPGTDEPCIGDLVWARHFGSDGDLTLRNIDVASDGSILITGHITGDADFGLEPLVHAGGDDAFVLKIDDDGQPVWQAHVADVDSSTGMAIAATPDGGAVIAGVFRGQVNFGSDSFTNLDPDTDDAALVRLDDQGAVVWAQHFGGASEEQIHAVAVDGEGNVFAAGSYEVELAIPGGTTLTEGSDNGRRKAFLLARFADGQRRWEREWGTDDDDQRVLSLGWAADGNLLAGGEFNGEIDFGHGIYTANGRDAFVASFSVDDGDPLWSTWITATTAQVVRTVRACPDGTVAVAGTFNGALKVGDGEPIGGVDEDVFVARLSEDGEHLRSSGIDGTVPDEGYAHIVECDANGHTLVAGAFDAELGYGATAKGAKDVFMAKIDDDDQAFWFRTLGDQGDEQGKHIMVDPNDGSVIVAGSFDATLVVGDETFTKLGGAEDMFVVKLTP